MNTKYFLIMIQLMIFFYLKINLHRPRIRKDKKKEPEWKIKNFV